MEEISLNSIRKQTTCIYTKIITRSLQYAFFCIAYKVAMLSNERYRIDGSLFNLRLLQANRQTQVRLIRDLLFADDATLVAHTEQVLQRITSCFADESRLFGLDINLRKTEVLHQPVTREEHRPPYVSISNVGLMLTQLFTYLGCIISSHARIDKEIDNRFSKANCLFVILIKRV